MFDLFASPADRILSRIPVHMHHEFWKLKAVIEADENFHDLVKPDLAGYVLSVWACRSAQMGKMQLTKKVYDAIGSIGARCKNRHSVYWDRFDSVANALARRGLIPNSS